MDSYTLGYYAGRLVTKIVIGFSKSTVVAAAGAKIALSGYPTLSKIAKAHRINSNDPAAVTKNLFDCIKYID